MIWNWDVKFSGVGTDFHLLCLDPDKQQVACERLFGLHNVPVDYDRIRHEYNLRVAKYWSYGSRFQDVMDTRGVNATKIQGVYYYHLRPAIQLGGGAGLMQVYGNGFDSFTLPIVTPASVIISPMRTGLLKAVTFRLEETYLAGALTGPRFGNTTTTYSKPNGEWNFSFGVGVDFRAVLPGKKPS